ncbi:hypothetical protein HJC10_01420 [Corallococcus exiguus]|nr:hypothetical protein [Corallococcus exiguus]NPC47174.1 hypothetical protein [Corallococcus exiguus]
MRMSLIRGLVVAVMSWGASASAQTSFSLTPPCAPGLCGASRLGAAAMKPAGAVGDSQYIEVDVAATQLLQSSSGIALANPNTARRPWYAVTHFAAEPFNYSATFWVRSESYNSY